MFAIITSAHLITRKGEVRQDEEGIDTMRILGQNMAWLLKKM